MSGADAARRMTVEEWFELDDEEDGELVDGLLVDDAEPDFVHGMVVVAIMSDVFAWAQPRGGIVAGSRAKYVISPNRGRRPDATVYLRGRPRPPARGLIRVPPSIALEVVSPSPKDAKRDRIDKVADYASFGIAYYWIVDPQLRTLQVLELGPDGRYVYALAASEGTVTGIPGCPDLSLDLSELWRSVDELEHTA